MKTAWLYLRSTLFTIGFYSWTLAACLMFLPGLLLPKKQALWVVRIWVGGIYLLEKYVLGLDYEVRGWEHVPPSGAFIVAAKHESPYETMKLNRLFADPAIILKKELLRVPLWGPFLAKAEPIAIDRRSGKQAITQLVDGARLVQAQGRPIIIFPQGTRVRPETTVAERPYKIGVARMAVATGMPVIPLALNSGVFWPKGAWLKKPGQMVFEFLPALRADEEKAMLRELEEKLEAASRRLAEHS